MSEENVLLRVRPTRLNTTRQHRALYEQVFVRFPGLVRALSLLRLRLPLRSRLRRFLLLRFAALASVAANRQDFDLLFTGFDPQLDLRTAAGVYPTELSGHHYGHSGYRDLWAKLLEVWEYVRIEPEELIDTGDCIISLTRVDTRGAGSGVPVSMTSALTRLRKRDAPHARRLLLVQRGRLARRVETLARRRKRYFRSHRAGESWTVGAAMRHDVAGRETLGMAMPRHGR